MTDDERVKSRKWWENSIIDIKPGKISIRGCPIEDLMVSTSFAQMMFFVVMGKELTKEEAELFEIAMVMSVDHGPQAPSIAIARMASTCGVSINNALASAVNVLGDNHGGAGQACAEIFYSIESDMKDGMPIEKSVKKNLSEYVAQHGKMIPGYGHRFHIPTDPRAVKTLEVVEAYAHNGHIKGVYKDIALEVHRQINMNKSTPIPLNVDGATAIIFCELGVPAPLCRGFFCLSRSVGIIAHAWEESQSGIKNKGPIPREFMPYYKPRGAHND